MSKKNLLMIGIVILLVIAAVLVWYFAFRGTVYLNDTTLSGNQVITEKIVLKNGAVLTVDGNLTMDGKITCRNGELRLVVNGQLQLNGELNCERGAINDNDLGQGILIVAKNGFESTDQAVISSNGHVQVVSSVDELATTQEEIDAIYKDAGTDDGEGPRLGPFIKVPILHGSIIEPKPYTPTPEKASKISKFIESITPKAQAEDGPGRGKDGFLVPDTWKIGGKWIMGQPHRAPPPVTMVPTPPKNIKKIILNFNFGSGTMHLSNWTLWGPDGDDGDSDDGSCTVKGKNGRNAMRMNVRARNIRISNFDLWLGSGGKGGNAVTNDDCDPAKATGGNGGEPGNFKMRASGDFTIAGSFNIHPGLGGQGGDAHAFGENKTPSCKTEKGGKATATGGNGADNKKGVNVKGTVNGISNVTVDELNAGPGGNANAIGGDGSDGDECGCDGGLAGNATATGGKGGDATSRDAASSGGNGGDASAIGGEGGEGGDCGPEDTGGDGGAGGDATATPGSGGTGKTNVGQNGQKENQLGGPGGVGGDGCLEGWGGLGGSGEPDGPDGEDGQNLCPAGGEGDLISLFPQEIHWHHVIGRSSCPDPIDESVTLRGPTGVSYEVSPEVPWIDSSESSGTIETEIVSLDLTFNCNISNFTSHTESGRVNVQVTDPNTGFVLGDSFFDVFIEVSLP